MSVQQNLSAVADNDLLWNVGLKLNGEPLDLTPFTITVYLKPSQTSPDGEAVEFTIGDGLAYTAETFGQFTWDVPRADTGDAGTQWYRIDLEAAGAIVTAMYGTLTLIAA